MRCLMICLIVFLSKPSLSSAMIGGFECEHQNWANHGIAIDQFAKGGAFWPEQLQENGKSEKSGDHLQLSDDVISKLSNKQRMLEAIFGAFPEDCLNVQLMNGGGLSFSMEEYEQLKKRKSFIFDKDPALSQLLSRLFAAGMSAKRTIQSSPSGSDSFFLVKTLKQRLAFALLFLAKRNRIRLNEPRRAHFVLTKSNIKLFLEDLSKLSCQANNCRDQSDRKCDGNCAINDFDNNGNGGGNRSRNKRILQFISTSLQHIDLDGTLSLLKRPKNANRRRRRKRLTNVANYTALLLVFIIFAIIFMTLSFLFCDGLLAASRNRHADAEQRSVAAVELSQLNNKYLNAFKGIPSVVVEAKNNQNEQTEEGEEQLECAICLGAIELGTNVRPLPICKHEFHNECIEMWIQGEHNGCPICRQEIVSIQMLSPTTTLTQIEQRQNDAAHSNGGTAQNDAIVIEINEAAAAVNEEQNDQSFVDNNFNNDNIDNNDNAITDNAINIDQV